MNPGVRAKQTSLSCHYWKPLRRYGRVAIDDEEDYASQFGQEFLTMVADEPIESRLPEGIAPTTP